MAGHQTTNRRRSRRRGRCTLRSAGPQQSGTPVAARSGVPAAEGTRVRWPLEFAEHAFTLLALGPSPLSVDGAVIGHGLPRRAISVTELRVMLMHPATSSAAREAVWRHVVRPAAGGDPAWTVAAVGLAMPGLKRLAVRLSRADDPITEDASLAMLAGFLTALRSIDSTVPESLPGCIAGWLCWRAFDAGKAFRDAERRVRDRQAPPPGRDDDPEASGRVLPLPSSIPPPVASGHPDFVLARAIRAGVITRQEADLIGRSRLERVSMQVIADELGVSQSWACRLRKAAEARLVAAIYSEDL